MPKQKQKQNGQFVMIPYRMLDSKMWQKLPFSAQSVYIQMRRSVFRRIGDRVINKDPNKVWFSYGDCPFMDKKTFYNGLKALRISGFIDVKTPGMFTPKNKSLYGFSQKWKAYERELESGI